ncbi:MAG TPA: ribonuclease HII [Methanomassiliicoccaceae archaeon]|nr:ribonuclease HII [Methanomassiliicoccaceae archaeon]HPT74403.1 ribonuclease HII [Methanomassiliicoccaceae archaeon]
MICGADEAGRGPVIGPLVVAAVMVEDDLSLRELKVKDSKLLAPARREELYEHIMAIARVETSVASPEEIDARGESSLNELEVQHFAAVIDRLAPQKVFIDAADVVAERFGREILSLLHCQPDLVSCHRADVLYPVVSAASIIAKVVRDRTIRSIEEELGEPVGSGYPTDPVTMAFLERWTKRNGDLPPHTRRSWTTARKMYSRCKTSTLDQWMEIP